MRAPVGGAQQQRGGAARLACSGRKGTVAAVPSSAISSSDRSKSSLSLMANSAVCGGTNADASRAAELESISAEFQANEDRSGAAHNTALYSYAAVAATALSHATAHRPSSTMSNAEDVKSEDSKADPNIVSIKVRGQVR